MTAPRQQDRSLRAFFAASLPDAARREIAAQVEGIRAGARHSGARDRRSRDRGSRDRGWIPAANYHVTLRFLGSVSGEDLAAIQNAAEQALAERSAFIVETGAPLWLRAHRGRQVLALSVNPEGPLQELAGDLAEGAQLLPHLTLARVDRDTRRSLEVSHSDFSPVSWEVREVDLFESRSTADGVRYEIVASIPLERSTLAPRIAHQGEEHGSQRI